MREEILINNDWRFTFGDHPEARMVEYKDTDWYDIGLPHTFSLPYFMESEFYIGYGCYRKNLRIHKEWIGKQISLIFAAAFQSAEIYINGSLAGTHKGGYTAFIIPVTQFVQEGDNLIFVRLNNLWDARIAPRGGEHVFSGGLYRDVSLLITDEVHVNWNGTVVTTSKICEKSADINIETEIVNDKDTDMTCRLESLILVEGRVVFEASKVLNIGAHRLLLIETKGKIEQPKLWHPDHPHLYQLNSRVYVDDKLYDEYMTTFGIRYFHFDKDEGFFLNGEHYDILGANVHQDHAGWGDGITRAAVQRDVQMIKDCGMNFIRGSHYPHHQYFAKACDEIGLLFWSELCYWGTAGSHEDGYWTASAFPIREEDEADFERNCFDTLEEMVRQNRNSPSLIVWSMCNEPFFSAGRVQDKACELARRLVTRCHELDTTRPAALGGVQRGNFDLIGDIAGYNGDGAAIYIHPDIPNLVSEYGSVVSDRPGEFIPNFGDTEGQNYRWRSGKALWCAFHHGSIFNDMGHMGMIDYARLPLRTYYWYQKELLGLEIPLEHKEGVPYALSLTSDKTSVLTDGTDDAYLVISLVDKDGLILSNSLEVILTVEEGGGVFPTGKTMVFNFDNGRFLDGQGAVEFRTYYSGRNRITAKAEGVKPAEIVITGIDGELWQNQQLNYPKPAPYKVAMPATPKGTLISLHKPVFCSSYKMQYPSNCLTEDNNAVWIAEGSRNEWVMVDLEGTNTVSAVEIKFAQKVRDGYRVSYSCDRSNFTQLNNGVIIEEQLVRFNLVPTAMRFLSISFDQDAQILTNIHIYS